MEVSPEALLVWQKALRKLQEATATPADTFPGIVVVSSYAAMRNAAVAVLLAVGQTAPPAETAIVASFGAIMGPKGSQGYQHGAAFNRAFDLKNAEDYDPVDSPSTKDAQAVQRDAQALMRYCSLQYKFPSIDTTGEKITP